MSSYSALSDITIADLLLSGDPVAFTEIFNRYWHKMFVHALKMTGDEDEAADLVQEVFTTLWTKAQAGEIQIQNLPGYLYMSTRNRVLNCMRQKKTQTNLEAALLSFIQDNQYSVLDKITEQELASALDNEITNLPPAMRRIFEMSRKNYLSYKEIGQALNISDNTVKKQISNAIKILRVKFGIFIILALSSIFLLFL